MRDLYQDWEEARRQPAANRIAAPSDFVERTLERIRSEESRRWRRWRRLQAGLGMAATLAITVWLAGFVAGDPREHPVETAAATAAEVDERLAWMDVDPEIEELLYLEEILQDPARLLKEYAAILLTDNDW